jgi:hypothetical protein
VAAVHEDYTPIYQGDTGTPFAPVFQKIDPNSGNPVPVPLNGLTLSMKMKEQETGEIKTCAAAWVIDNATAGQAHYPWQAGDVDTPGIWQVQITCTDSAGKPVHSDVKLLEIKATW